MDVVLESCCGIDVHKRTIVVCLMVGRSEEKAKKTVKTFSTMTRDLLACKDWLESQGCTQVALESTGVYWKPVFNILEESMEVILANAREIKNVPGRKTDVKDSEWIAQLVRHGLIRGSFIPPKPIRELRDLTRYRQKLIQQKASEIKGLQKFLEEGNIKLASVVSDIHGRSAQEMIQHLIQDDLTAKEMADLAKGSLRKKLSELESALEGFLTDHHRGLFRICLQRIACFEEAIEKLNEQIDRKMEPYLEISERLQSIPGLKKNPPRPSLQRSEWI